MTIGTFVGLIFLGMSFLCFIIMKVSEKYISLDYFDQKVVICDGGNKRKSKERRAPCAEDAPIAVHI
jgi:hypothetical protein